MEPRPKGSKFLVPPTQEGNSGLDEADGVAELIHKRDTGRERRAGHAAGITRAETTRPRGEDVPAGRPAAQAWGERAAMMLHPMGGVHVLPPVHDSTPPGRRAAPLEFHHAWLRKHDRLRKHAELREHTWLHELAVKQHTKRKHVAQQHAGQRHAVQQHTAQQHTV